MGNLRNSFKPIPIKKFKENIDKDNVNIGANTNEYLQLEDGKAVKIRIFPAHPGVENFYVSKKSYWLSMTKNDGDIGRGTVLDSIIHGGTEKDIVQEYVKFCKQKHSGNVDILEALTGKEGLSPSYTWLCYASKVTSEGIKTPILWEFKKMVRDQINKFASQEDEDEPIEVDPFTDVDEGIPIFVTFRRTPNKKKGENFYEVSIGNKPKPLPIPDDVLENFSKMVPLDEVIQRYQISDFERALEGLQNFDAQYEIDLFSDDDWLTIVEEVKSQYEEGNKAVSKVKKEEDDEAEEDDEVEHTDEFSEMDRTELKRYIIKCELDITVKKSWSDEDIREAIRETVKAVSKVKKEEDEEPEEDDEQPEETPSRVTIEDIRAKLRKK